MSEAKDKHTVAMDSLEVVALDKNALTKDGNVNDIIKNILKDSGIKAQVIKQWLPTLNNEINNVLERMDAPYAFTLDENFDETILSRFRDNFGYASFSEGETARINIAILFAFRQVAMLKSTINSNIIVLDEIGDSALDIVAYEIFLEMLKETGLSVFVVSHKNAGDEIFDEIINVRKEGNFSVISSAL